MKKNTIIFLIIGIIVLVMLGYGYFKAAPRIDNQADSYPRIEITPKIYDFGDINFGDVVEYDFKIKNSGDEVLNIKRIATSCPCSSAKVEKETLEPGEEVNLSVSYDSGAMGPHGKGKQERIIYIRSDDPANPQIEVMIYANVK